MQVDKDIKDKERGNFEEVGRLIKSIDLGLVRDKLREIVDLRYTTIYQFHPMTSMTSRSSNQPNPPCYEKPYEHLV
jgi:hypothetical protein